MDSEKTKKPYRCGRLLAWFTDRGGQIFWILGKRGGARIELKINALGRGFDVHAGDDDSEVLYLELASSMRVDFELSGVPEFNSWCPKCSAIMVRITLLTTIDECCTECDFHRPAQLIPAEYR